MSVGNVHEWFVKVSSRLVNFFTYRHKINKNVNIIMLMLIT